MDMRFEWSPAKATSNLRKHRVSFEIAMRVFSDPFAAEHVQFRSNRSKRVVVL